MNLTLDQYINLQSLVSIQLVKAKDKAVTDRYGFDKETEQMYKDHSEELEELLTVLTNKINKL